MAKITYAADTLTGGVSGCLDDILHTALEDGNTATVISSADGKTYFLVYDASETGAESSPDIIIPDSNVTGTGAWVLAGIAPAIDLSTLTATASEINTACDGITATATEINTACDGVLATAAEINSVCDGASSGSDSPGQDFTSGTIYWYKIGDLVTVYWTSLGHASSNLAESTPSIIPVGFRPAATCFTVVEIGTSYITRASVSTDGTFASIYRTYAGVLQVATSLLSGSMTYRAA